MKPVYFIALFLVILAAATIANLLALKIAADQVSSSVSSSPLANLLGSLKKG